MFQNFTNKALVLASVALSLTFTACKKDDDASPDEAACKVTSFTNDGDETTSIQYNDKGYISKMTEVEVDNDGTSYTYTTTFIYDSNNQLTKVEYRENNVLEDYNTYEYSGGLMTTEKYYESAGQLYSTKKYSYDGNKRVKEIERSYTNSNWNYTTKYTFNSKGNVEKEEDYYNNVLNSKTVYSDYDDKPTPFLGVKGLPQDEIGFSSNNPRKEVYTYYGDVDGDGDMDEYGNYTETYTYQYNDKGFPVKITETDEDGDSYITTIAYECK